MANTSLHLPNDLLARLDREAERRRMSRNRLIVQACERVFENEGGEWPPRYFSETRVPKPELADLHGSFSVWMSEIESARRSRRRPPF